MLVILSLKLSMLLTVEHLFDMICKRRLLVQMIKDLVILVEHTIHNKYTHE